MRFFFLVLRKKKLNLLIMTLEITEAKILQLSEIRLNPAHWYYLEEILAGNQPNLPSISQALDRKGLIAEGKITEEGKAFVEAIRSNTGESVKKIVEIDLNALEAAFGEWWETYPRNSKFEWKGRIFDEKRPLRLDKDKCREKYIAILQTKEYSHSQLLSALKAELIARKELSIKKGRNEMMWMKGSTPYLNQKAFEAYIGEEVEEEKSEGTVFTMDM